ncbi:alpha/beta hydrolase [Synechococcus sp. UW179A]|uniref:alpha/beta hydrolase n=1 Tax=Synechococcus sp. UW179A TaxID=2575510 RepID=UPI000E0EEA68|nr:alpha/beta hydrolase [Synechococcus sp. UW179A]
MSARSRLRRHALATGSAMALSLLSSFQPVHAAKDVALVSGAFIRSISVADLAYLAETGKARGVLADLLKLSRQDPEDVAKLLNQELNLPLVLTSRLMSTRIGDVILTRVARIIYPLKVPAPSVSVPALRAGVINGLQIGEGGLTAIKFLEAYPSEVMEVNIPALIAVIEKAESIAGLVQFFSDSPLDGLKDGSN